MGSLGSQKEEGLSLRGELSGPNSTFLLVGDPHVNHLTTLVLSLPGYKKYDA